VFVGRDGVGTAVAKESFLMFYDGAEI